MNRRSGSVVSPLRRCATAALILTWMLALTHAPHTANAAEAKNGAGQPIQPVDRDVASYNYILGTQTIAPQYKLTDKTDLVETAEAILAMGSNTLKIALGPDYRTKKYRLPENPSIHTLSDLAGKEPSYRKVLGMPFTYYLLWTYSFSADTFTKESFPKEEQEKEYREVYDFARYLLATYNGSGKTFFLGNWEGDWHLVESWNKREPRPGVAENMIVWLNIRQKAIDDAKRDVPHKNVQLYHYLEVCLTAPEGKTVTNLVLPHTNPDFVSYSSWDCLGWGGFQPFKKGPALRAEVKRALDHIESRLTPKPAIHGKRVFLGEFGFFPKALKNPAEADGYCREVMRAGLEWGCPFILYWEMYCNIIDADGTYARLWLIDNKGVKQPLYHTYQRFLEEARRYVADFKKQNGRLPSAEEYRRFAVPLLERVG